MTLVAESEAPFDGVGVLWGGSMPPAVSNGVPRPMKACESNTARRWNNPPNNCIKPTGAPSATPEVKDN